jgi:protein O-GlcNAc transferase
MARPRTKPKIRVLHHLARCGGTLISRCLGSMQGVNLLSEVHPDTMNLIDPVRQAKDWYSLVTDAEAKAWKRRGGVEFAQLLTLASFRAGQHGRALVLRDWTHIDYHGVPYTKPTMHPRIVEALENNFEIVRTATVRHPIDAYLSLMKLEIMKGVPLPPKNYLEGCERFAEEAARIGFIRYEDFTREPDASLETICERLDVPFDSSYIERWAGNDHVTGDTTGTRGGRHEIRPLTRRETNPKTIEAFRAHDSYHHIKDLLGYEED